VSFLPRLAAPLRPALASLLLLAAGACGGDADRPVRDQLRGVELPAPLARPAFTLPATDGSDYAFDQRTKGQLTFLFFGYTHCPDICPVHVANIATILRTLKYEDRQRAQLVFVSVDPARDSLPLLRDWLAQFDDRFIGLVGPLDSVNAIMASINLPPAFLPEPDADGNYYPGHAAQVIVFEEDDRARLIYPFGTRQVDWAHDIPRLLARHRD
jgi:protein SCO1